MGHSGMPAFADCSADGWTEAGWDAALLTAVADGMPRYPPGERGRVTAERAGALFRGLADHAGYVAAGTGSKGMPASG